MDVVFSSTHIITNNDWSKSKFAQEHKHTHRDTHPHTYTDK